MEILTRPSNQGVVVEVSGRMVYGTPVHDLHDAVRQLVAQGVDAICVDLAHVSALDSTGLEILIASYVTCMRGGAAMRLINPGPKAKIALQVTKLDALFSGHQPPD